MKKIFISFLAVALVAPLFTSCIEEYDPKNGSLTEEQAKNSPGYFDSAAEAITANLIGQFSYIGYDDNNPWDIGYPTFFLARDVMGQDMVTPGKNNWWIWWYSCDAGLGPNFAVCQIPWTNYYSWIDACNKLLTIYKSDPKEDYNTGAGIAYTMRAMFYQDIVRMYAAKPYALNPEAETVPMVTEDTEISDSNPRISFKGAYEQIIEDLNKAEELLEGFQRPNFTVPDVSVVYGLKARAYLEIQDWANAEKYAKMAQEGYEMMSEEEYLSRDNGFNTPTSSWMFGMQYHLTDPCIRDNDGDSSWGSWMILENGFECGYAANYGGPLAIDRHLYETIPASDFRKKMFVDFAIDEMESGDAVEALKAYSDHPEQILASADADDYGPGGFELKFRPAAGKYAVKYEAWVVAVPLMRVEEMKLIEAEAAGMQNEARGIQLLTAFAQTRDPQYYYGSHQDAYGNGTTSKFQNEVWWQRRVELWGEGFATFDMKRLNKAIIRNYEGSNHVEGYRWNFANQGGDRKYPDWMNFCIVQTETNYNKGCTNNATPVAPTGDSELFVW